LVPGDEKDVEKAVIRALGRARYRVYLGNPEGFRRTPMAYGRRLTIRWSVAESDQPGMAEVSMRIRESDG